MALTDYKVENNAETTLLGSISASATSIIVSGSEGDLFPSSFPFKITLEKFNSDTIPKVIKREIVDCTNRIGDSFTITRASESCVQNDTASPKTRTNNALAFDSGDKVSLYDTKSQRDDITDEVIRLEEDKLDKSVYDSEKNVYGASSEGTDAYKITDASITSYSEKNIYKVKADVANTGVCTFEINSLGAKAVKKEQGTTDLIDNDWKAGGIATLQYNSTLDVFQFTGQNAIVVSTSSESTQTEFTAGEAISAGDALRNGIVIVNEVSNTASTTGNNSHTRIGYNTTDQKTGQSITISGSNQLASKISAVIRVNGSPSGNLTMKIFSDTSGTLIATSQNTVAEGQPTGFYDFLFNDEPLPTGTIYVSIETDRGNSTSNYSNWTTNSGNVYSGGVGYGINSSNTWSAESNFDKGFVLETKDLSETLGKVYKTDASDSSKINFIGFANSSAVLDGTLNINTAGVDGNQSGLVVGSDYYLSNTNILSPGSPVNITDTGNQGNSTSGLNRIGTTISIPANTYNLTITDFSCVLNSNGGNASVTMKVFDAPNGNLLGTGSTENFNTLGSITFTPPAGEIDVAGLTSIFIGLEDSNSTMREIFATNNYYTGGRYYSGSGTYTAQGTNDDLKMELDITTNELVGVSNGGIALLENIVGSNIVKVGKAVSETELLINTLPEQEADIDFVTFTTSGGGSSYSTTYNHNLGKIPTKFEVAIVNNSGNTPSHGWYEQGKYGCVGRDGGAREDAMGIIYYSGNDYFKMTVNTITDTQFTITYTESGSCSTVSGMNVVIRIQ